MSLRGFCTICTDYFDTENDISVTPCGHLFHAACLNQWIATSGVQRTCPQCRRPVVPKRIISKVFINVPEESEIQLDPYVLKNKLDEVETLLTKYKNENSDLQGTLKAMEDLKDKLGSKIKQLKSDLNNEKNVSQLLKSDMETLKTEVSYTRLLKEELKQLKLRLKTLEKVEVCINGQKEEVDEMLNQYSQSSNNREAKQLAVFCVAMKQEYETIKESRNRLNDELMRLKRELHKKEQLLLLKVSACEDLEKTVVNLQQSEEAVLKENKSLQKKIKALQLAISSPTDTKTSAINRLLAESPAPEFLTPINGKSLSKAKALGASNTFSIKKPRLSSSFDSVEVDLNDSLPKSNKKDIVLCVPETPESSVKSTKKVDTPKKLMAMSKPTTSLSHNYTNPLAIRKRLLNNSSHSIHTAGYDGLGGHKKTPLQMSKVSLNISSKKFSSANTSLFKENFSVKHSSILNKDRFSRLKRKK